MVVPDELAHAGTGAPPLDGAFSPSWWHSRTSDELQAIVHRGMQGGDLFFGAAAEMERRAKEAEAARDAKQEQAVRISRRLGWELKALFAVLAVAGLILLLR